MDLFEARRMAVTLMQEHGIGRWRLVFDHAKTRAGHCHHDRREIALSAPLTRLHRAQDVRETVLHEIAHALVGPEHKHDDVWRVAAQRIGCSGSVTLVTSEQLQHDWVGACAVDHETQRHRRPQRPLVCAECARVGLAELLTWRYRGAIVPMTPAFRAQEATLRQRSGLATGA